MEMVQSKTIYSNLANSPPHFRFFNGVKTEKSASGLREIGARCSLDIDGSNILLRHEACFSCACKYCQQNTGYGNAGKGA